MDETRENTERWRRDGLLNIKPDSFRFGEFPEGWDVITTLSRHITTLPHEHIVDIGCGYGRLCRAFESQKYVGVDINASAIDLARRSHPSYRFLTVSEPREYPRADIYLAYTVFLHFDNRALKDLLKTITEAAEWIVIAEILGDAPLDEGKTCAFEPHAVYHRTKQDYQDLLADFDFVCWEEIRKTYHFYGKAEISILVFRRRDTPDWIDLPDGLRSSDLQFDGIYDDGWIAREFSLRLSRPEQARVLQIWGMLPAIDPHMLGCRVRVSVEGQEEHVRDLPLGSFQMQIPVETQVRLPWITIRLGAVQVLPPPDNREVSLLLKAIGFAE